MRVSIAPGVMDFAKNGSTLFQAIVGANRVALLSGSTTVHSTYASAASSASKLTLPSKLTSKFAPASFLSSKTPPAPSQSSQSSPAPSKSSPDVALSILWHRCFGHMSFDRLKAAVNDSTSSGLPPRLSPSIPPSPCESCLAGKQTRDPFPKTASGQVLPLELVHSDLHGPLPPTANRLLRELAV